MLQAWNGYNGNVYFEPIQICPVNDSMDSSSTSSPDKSNKLLGKRAASERIERHDSATTRSNSRQTAKSVRSSNRPVVILDKGTVLDRYNEELTEDLTLIEGIECTGSLTMNVRPHSDKPMMDKSQKRSLMYEKERICKGSVINRIRENSLRNPRSLLKVNGGKFVPTSSLSPLLRTQTQYSLSNQRLTTNSPDPFHHHLPPLEQFRASVRHMDAADQANKAHYNKQLSVGGEIKPFIKYSPDARPRKQAAY